MSSSVRGRRSRKRRRDGGDEAQAGPSAAEDNNAARNKLRDEYREIQHSIKVDKEAIGDADSSKFTELVSRMDELHRNVKRPREQIADAAAVLEVVKCFIDSMRDARSKTGITPDTFVEHIIRRFSLPTTHLSLSTRDHNPNALIDWGSMGMEVCGVFKTAPGLNTMLGPMDKQPRPRRVLGVRRPRLCPPQYIQATEAEEVEDPSQEETISQTGVTIQTMFAILKDVKQARLDALILNRESFAETAENSFSLSFLVNDGRAGLGYDEDGHHIVVPKNAPTAEARASGEAKNTAFVFQFDSSDWQCMVEDVPEGSELMPNRGLGKENHSIKREPNT